MEQQPPQNTPDLKPQQPTAAVRKPKHRQPPITILSESQLHSARARSLRDRQEAESGLDREHRTELDELIDLSFLPPNEGSFGDRITEGFNLLLKDE